MEQWKPIKGYEELYEISSYGNICIKTKKKLLKLNKNSRGYIVITFTKNKIQKSYSVHRLVAEAFIPNPENKPQVNHINGDKTDNRVENLEWCTGSENMQHCYKNNLQKKRFKRVNQYTLDNCFVKQWDSLTQIEKELHIKHSKVSMVCNCKRKKAGNFIWRYADEKIS